MSNATSLATRADVMAHDRNYAQARPMLEEALRLEPNYVFACESMSFVSIEERKFAEAVNWSAQALAATPQSYRANYYHAEVLLAQGATDERQLYEAAGNLRAAIKMNPSFSQAHDQLAFVLSQRGPTQNLNEAYMSSLRAVEYDLGNVYYRVRSVDVLEAMGRDDDAVRAANNAVALAKTSQDKDLAGACLAGAKQYKISKKKMQEVQETSEKAGASSTLLGF